MRCRVEGGNLPLHQRKRRTYCGVWGEEGERNGWPEEWSKEGSNQNKKICVASTYRLVAMSVVLAR